MNISPVLFSVYILDWFSHKPVEICMRMFGLALFIKVKDWKLTKCLSSGEVYVACLCKWKKTSCRSITYIIEAVTGCGHNTSMNTVIVIAAILPILQKGEVSSQDVQLVNGRAGLCTQESRLFLMTTLCCIWRIVEEQCLSPLLTPAYTASLRWRLCQDRRMLAHWRR